MSDLETFFTQMRSFLLGECDATQVEHALGPSRSGTENLGFYRTLIKRNFDKFLGDMYPSVQRVARGLGPERWDDLVEEYTPTSLPTDFDPNGFSRGFPGFLCERRQRDPAQPQIMEELADFQWLRHEVNIADDGEEDGFEQRLFIRQYAHPVPKYWRAIMQDPSAPLPEPRPTIVIVFRSLTTSAPEFLVPSPAELAALARRQGLALPPALAELPEDELQAARSRLIERGVLVDRPS